jgi:ankyrin repeat protein
MALTDLYLACIDGNLEQVTDLLLKNTYNPLELTASLLDASYCGHIEIVKALFAKGATALLNRALGRACANGKLDVAKFLISQGATDLDDALEQACFTEQLEVVFFLIKQGATSYYRIRNRQTVALKLCELGLDLKFLRGINSNVFDALLQFRAAICKCLDNWLAADVIKIVQAFSLI